MRNDMKALRKNIEIKKAVLIMWLILLLLFAAGPGVSVAQKVYIDIESPAFQRFPVAVAAFQDLGPDAATKEESAWFSDRLSRLLDMTGHMRLIPRGAFLENQKEFPYKGGRVSFPDWTVVGAEYLVKGGVSRTGKDLAVEFRLYDVVKGDRMIEKRYTGRWEERMALARMMARDITQVLTGDGSVFETKIAFVAKHGVSSDIFTIHFDGSDLTRVTNFKSVALSPRWSPDGRTIGFISYKDGNPDLYFRRMKDFNTRKISDFRGLNILGGWSPDGQRLLLTLSKDGNEEIYQLNLGSGQLTRLTHDFSIDVSPVWSPDGRRIAFVSNRSGSPQIFVMGSDGTQSRRVTFEGNYNTSPAWSPDGRRIAYEGLKEGRFKIFTLGVDGGGPMQIGPVTGDNESPTWSPDGRYVVFSQRGRGAGKIAVMNSNGTNIRVLYENPFGCLSPAWSPRLQP
jgi:TolB protein